PGDIILQTMETTTIATVADCNSNGVDDLIDIQQMSTTDPCLADCNNNMIPDCCDVDPSDPDNNGEVSDDNLGIVNGVVVQQPDGFPDECIPSACCFSDGSCQLVVPPDCSDMGGSPLLGQTCEDAACQVPPAPCCFDNCPCELLSSEVCEARGGTPQLGALTCEDAGCQLTPCDDGDPCTADVCVDGRCQFIPIDNPTPCCLPDGTCQVLPCAEACDAMGGTPTDSCNGSTTVSLLPTAVFRTPVAICGGGAGCPAAMSAMILGLASLRIGNRRRRRRANR
ncbi:MAG: hypothetical protein O7B26_12975, partial [Planctomycetota bacterium]|nr:hypothetical protein [Planctomycetota bacterium]